MDNTFVFTSEELEVLKAIIMEEGTMDAIDYIDSIIAQQT